MAALPVAIAHGCCRSEPVSGPKLAAVDRGLLFFHTRPGGAGGPAQLGVGAQGKHHGGAIEVGLEAHPFLGWGHGKVECLAKFDRVQFADLGTDGGVIDLSLYEKGSGIRPVQSRNLDVAPTMNEPIGVNSRKWARPRNAGGSYIVERIIGSRVERGGRGGRLPLSIRGTGGLMITGNVS